MSRIERREIARLTALLAARRVAAATLTAAYVLRGAVRAVGAATRNLTAVAAETPISPTVCARYAADCIGALALLGERRTSRTRESADDRLAQPGAPAWRIVLPPAGEVSLLTDERVRALQGSIVRSVFGSRFGIKPRAHELEVLSAYSSVAWLARGLLIAAGYAGTAPPAELAHRCTVVYPAFYRALSLHRAQIGAEDSRASPYALLNRAFPGSADARDETGRRASARRLVIGPVGEFSRSLYPDSIVIERLKLRTELVLRRTRAEARSLKNTESLVLLAIYMAAVTLIVHAAGRSGRRAARMIARIEKTNR